MITATNPPEPCPQWALTRLGEAPPLYSDDRFTLDFKAHVHDETHQVLVHIPADGPVAETFMEFYDLAGRRIIEPFSLGTLGPGSYLLRLDNRHHPGLPGLYLWRVSMSGGPSFSGRTVLLQ